MQSRCQSSMGSYGNSSEGIFGIIITNPFEICYPKKCYPKTYIFEQVCESMTTKKPPS